MTGSVHVVYLEQLFTNSKLYLKKSWYPLALVFKWESPNYYIIIQINKWPHMFLASRVLILMVCWIHGYTVPPGSPPWFDPICFHKMADSLKVLGHNLHAHGRSPAEINNGTYRSNYIKKIYNLNFFASSQKTWNNSIVLVTIDTGWLAKWSHV